MMPKLLYQRLDEIGTDFAVIYPTAGLRCRASRTTKPGAP
jgi:hypothetical protein